MSSTAISVERSRAWDAYWLARTCYTIERLVDLYRDIITPHVDSVFSRQPVGVYYEEIVVAALLGLYQAIVAYDQNKGVGFEVYAAWRIKNTILDEIRALDSTRIGRPQRANTIKQQVARMVRAAIVNDRIVDFKTIFGRNLNPDMQIKYLGLTGPVALPCP